MKPFALRELEARIGVLTRLRSPDPDQPLSVAGMELDPKAHLARREGKVIVLTRSQTRALECLMMESPRIVDRARLMRAMWGEGEADAAALHTHIYLLRGLVDKPFDTPLIHTVHGIGYRFGRDT